MSKNAYEIRLETLKMAKEMADTQFCLQQDIMYRMIDQAQEKREDIMDAVNDHSPMMYQPVDLIETANKLYTYVSEKKQDKNMAEEKKNGIVQKEDHNEFELAMRFLGNEIIAIKLAATNFNGKLIVYSI